MPDPGHPHLIDGQFQSDKYPTCPRGKVPLSVKDATAQDLLWEYAQRRRAVDPEFAADLEIALQSAGYAPTGNAEGRMMVNALIDRWQTRLIGAQTIGVDEVQTLCNLARRGVGQPEPPAPGTRTCSDCVGDGKVGERMCVPCDGTGRVPV